MSEEHHVPQSRSEDTCTTQVTQRTSLESQPTDNEPQPKKRKIFTFIDEQKSLIQSSTNNNSEIEEYLKEPCIEQTDNPLKYLKNSQNTYPTLAVIAKENEASPPLWMIVSGTTGTCKAYLPENAPK